MLKRFAAASLLAACLAAGTALAEDGWTPIPQENLLYMELSGGTAVIELYPDIAPGHVARMKELARAGFYDGLTFHRVIADFMAQGGDPSGTGNGASDKPDLKAEFTFHFDPLAPSFGLDRNGDTIGVDGASIILTEPEVKQYSRADGKLESWMPHCRGTVAMARSSNPNTGNSQFYIMYSDGYRKVLERQYTAFGRVVSGMGAIDRIEIGEPPARPTRIFRMRVGSDLPASDRITIETMAPDSASLKQLMDETQTRTQGRLNVCDVEIPTRVRPKTEESTQ